MVLNNISKDSIIIDNEKQKVFIGDFSSTQRLYGRQQQQIKTIIPGLSSPIVSKAFKS